MQHHSENVILVVLDGVRTQEMFGGLDKHLFTQIMNETQSKQKVEDLPVYKKYWAETAEERRQKIMPWLWGEFLKNHGCIVGDRNNGKYLNLFFWYVSTLVRYYYWRLNLGSVAQVANKYRFSYPGYSELLTGTPQDVINTNDFGQNIFPTICEFVKEKFQLDYNQVAVFASWRNLKDVSQERRRTAMFSINTQQVDRLLSARKVQW